ncbi:MAG: SdrD B-like domain-containing protein [Spirosomataceae bacterium]
MKNFITAYTKRTVGQSVPLQKNKSFIRTLYFLAFLNFLIAAPSGMRGLYAQCTTSAPSVLAKWNFNAQTLQCNGAAMKSSGDNTAPFLRQNMFTYCPAENNGCGQAILGSEGFSNTYDFAKGLCLSGYWRQGTNAYAVATGWSPNDLVFKPEIGGNILITYTLPAGKPGSLTSFALKLLQKQFDGSTLPYEKQGVGVYRNGVLIYNQTQNFAASNVNGTPLTFTFPSSAEFTSDGSTAVTWKVVFGLVHRLTQKPVGYDDICLNGTCGSSGSPIPVAAIAPATCTGSTANSDGKITLSNFGAADKYDFNTGTSYTGSQTYATATAIPAGGVITNTLPNPGSAQTYTVRVFTSAGCTTDLQVTLNPTICANGGCAEPTGTVAATPATCTGGSSNSNASIAVTGVTGGDKVGLSLGSFYAGPAYAAAQTLTGGAYTFSSLPNPNGSQAYTIRVYNAANTCFKDYPVTITETACACKKIVVQIKSSDQTDPNSTPNNNLTTEDDLATYEVCKDTKYIDLKLTKTVTPPNGTTCPTGTAFVWTLTLTNEGTMTATNIQVADDMPAGLVETANNPSSGTYNAVAGWLVPSLAPNASVTLTITTKATKAGTFQNCAWVNGAFPLNDIDSSPLNDGTANEDDDDCVSITVTGPKTPEITKEFSPYTAKTGVPVRLTIKIINNESSPIHLTAALVDNLPSTPAQMTVAATPNLTTGLTGVVANAGGTSITIPSGTVLLPGLNQIQVDVVAPSDGMYCNKILSGALKTTSCDNIAETEACVEMQSTYIMAPLIQKSFAPELVQTGQSSILTLTIENRNTGNMTLLEDFKDNFPSGMILDGTVSGTCPGISTFSSTDQVGLLSGTVLPAGTCTIIVPVKNTTAGTFQNKITMNNLIANVSSGNLLIMTGNEEVAEKAMASTSNSCTPIDITSITPATPTVAPNGTISLTVNGTGFDPNTVYTWSGTGSFSPQSAVTTYTAPATAGTYTIKIVADNGLTGFGTCQDEMTIDVIVQSSCVPPTATAMATDATCNGPTVNNDGKITLSGFTTEKYDYTLGNTYSGSATYATATTIPVGGVIVSNLPNPATSQTYTVRIFNGDDCYVDRTVTLTHVTCSCPVIAAPAVADANRCGPGTLTATVSTACAAGSTLKIFAEAGLTTDITASFTVGANTITSGSQSTTATYYAACQSDAFPTCKSTGDAFELKVNAVPAATAAATNATCNGPTVNSDGKITLSGFTTEKYDYTPGNTYTGSATYATATTIPVGGVIVSNLSNPATSQSYTVRIFNADGCYIDRTVTLTHADCTCPTVAAPAIEDGNRCGVGTLTANIAVSCTAGSSMKIFSDVGLTLDVTANFNIGANVITSGTLSATATYYAVCQSLAFPSCISSSDAFVLTVNSFPTATAAAANMTCSGPTANTDGKITLSGFTTEKYAYTLGSTYSGSATYATATTIPVGGVIVSNLSNPATSQSYTVRIFNAEGCYVDRTVTLTHVDCTCPTVAAPAVGDANRCGPGTLTATVTTACAAGSSLKIFSDAGLTTEVTASFTIGANSVTSGSLNATATYYATCQNNTFSTCISQGDPFVLSVNSFPTATAAATNATCNGPNENTNGKITLVGFAGERYDYTAGNTYTGTAVYATATVIPMGGVIVSNLPNPAVSQTYTIRIINADGCFVDRTVTLTHVTCTCPTVAAPAIEDGNRCGAGTLTANIVASCAAGSSMKIFSDVGLTLDVTANFNIGANVITSGSLSSTATYYAVCHSLAFPTCISAADAFVLNINTAPTATATATNATCNGPTANSDGKITLSGFTTERYAYTPGGTYTGNATYATATVIPAGGVIVNSLPNPATNQAYTVRIFNAAGCFIERTVTLTSTNCSCPAVAAPAVNDNNRCGPGTVTANIATGCASGSSMKIYSDAGLTIDVTANFTIGANTITSSSLSSTGTYYAACHSLAFPTCKSAGDVFTLTVNPTPNAGPDQTPTCVGTTPITAITLAATPANGGVWSQASGNPSGAVISLPSSASSSVTGLNPGVYRFIWSTGVACADTVKITVPTCAPAPQGSLGDYVWKDTNNNGVQGDAGDSPVKGVILELYKNGVATGIKDTTDINGKYLFSIIDSASYQVKILTASLPAGCSISLKQNVGNDASDSDFDPTSALSDAVTVNPFNPAKRHVLTVDAALVTACTKPTWVLSAAPVCAPNNQTYSVTFSVVGKNGIIKANGVPLSGNSPYTVTVQSGKNLVLTDSLSAACRFDTTIVAPNCGCPISAPVALAPSVTACYGEAIPMLSVFVSAGATANWYASQNATTPLVSGSLTFTPTAAGTYWVEAVVPGAQGCVSTVRTSVTLSVVTNNICIPVVVRKLRK